MRMMRNGKGKQFTFMSLLFQRFWYTFHTSFTVELSATTHLPPLCNTIGMFRTILRKECEIRCIWTFVRITFVLYHFVISGRSAFVDILFIGNGLRVTVSIIAVAAACARATAAGTGWLLNRLLSRLFGHFLLGLDRQNIRWKEKTEKYNSFLTDHFTWNKKVEI